MLSKENINKIVEAYRKFADIGGFSRVVDISEVRKNDYNLNVTLYVMPIEEKEQIDIFKEFQELMKIEEERKKSYRRSKANFRANKGCYLNGTSSFS